jgi:hypothetical protein
MEYPALPSSHDIRPDAARLWAGGAATAIVAALIALVGVLICRWTLGIPILAPQSDGAWGSAHTGEFVLAAALVALAATAVLYLLMLGTPQPGVFLKWIMGLVTLAAVVYPFSTSAPLDQKAATAAVDLVLGVAIASLLAAVAVRAVRRVETRKPLRGDYGPGNSGSYGPGGYERRGYDDRPGPRGYGDREYGRPDYDRGPQGYDRPGYDRGYGEHRGYDRGETPTRQYPPRDRWS